MTLGPINPDAQPPVVVDRLTRRRDSVTGNTPAQRVHGMPHSDDENDHEHHSWEQADDQPNAQEHPLFDELA
jgi:hypothetical protein